MENKRLYIKPILESEIFVPQEYVAKCAYNQSYKGKCDISGYVFNDTNGNGVYDEGIDKYKYKNTACEHYFETPIKPHHNAFIFDGCETKKIQTGSFLGIPTYDWILVGKGTPISIYNFDDTHANVNLDTTIHHNVS